MANKDEKLPSNPLLFPRERTPAFIVKSKNGRYHYWMREPTENDNYQWYMANPKLLTIEELEREMAVPNRRWFATCRPGFELTQKMGCNVTEGDPYVFLGDVHKSGLFWFGKRCVVPPPEKAVLILSVAELYLKSQYHQKRLIRILIEGVRRILESNQVFRTGNTMIEVRREFPSEEKMKLLSLLPGISKIYEAADNRDGDPRGKFIMDGASGMPILQDQPVLALISGGFDSPVAAYRMMTRGCFVHGIHFLNSTADTASIMEKNRRISERLSIFQGQFVMHYVDISSLQAQIVANVPNQNRTLIYKWLMLALAADFDDSKLLIVGDSVGQVASQTVANVSTLYPTIKKAIIAPLAGMQKNLILEVARKIETHDLSVMEGADCCKYMMCKLGANLAIGKRTLQNCVSKIKVQELPVITETFRSGKLLKTVKRTYKPDVQLRDAVVRKSVAKRDNVTSVSDPVLASNEDDNDILYFDAAAGTKVHEQVEDAMLRAPFANPNSLHLSGRKARMAVEQVRIEIAKELGVSAQDIIFTSGGTEANNIALHGYRVQRDIWSHPSTRGSESIPDDAPIVRVVDLVNHETGSINLDLKRPKGGRLHVDASQALTKIDLSQVDFSEVDSITITAHKINGPIGVGAVYLRNLKCNKYLFGGDQEKGIRPGTENVAAIVGFGAALRLDRSRSIHKEVEAFLTEELAFLGLEINRKGETSGYIVHATLPKGYDNTEVVSMLSAKYKIEIGTGSACKTGVVNTVVYDFLGKSPFPNRSIRISYDSFVSMNDAQRFVEALTKTLTLLKKK